MYKPSLLYFCNITSSYTFFCFSKFLPKISAAISEMEVPKKKLFSKPKPKCIQQKTMKSVHKVLKERRLCRAQAFFNAEAKAAERKSNLKRKTESVGNKPMDSASEVLKKRRLMENVHDRAPAEQKPERKLASRQKSGFIEKPATSADGEGRLTETRNQQQKNINPAISLKSTEKADEKKRTLVLRIKLPAFIEKPATLGDGERRLAKIRNQQEENINAENCFKSEKKAQEKKGVLCHPKKIKIDKGRQKRREAARLAIDQVNNTCGFEDNMQSMRDFEKLLACTGNAYALTADNYCYY